MIAGMPRTRIDKPYLREDRPGWWATFYDETGRRTRRLVGEPGTPYEDAVIARERLVQRVQMVAAGLASRRDMDIADARLTPILTAADAMLDEPRYKKRSEGHRRDIRAWLVRLTQTRVQTLGDLTPTAISHWLDGLVDADLSASTYNHALAAVRILCRWCVRRGWLRDDPTTNIAKQNEDEDSRSMSRALTHEELAALIAACASPERRLRYLLGARAGLRQWEVDRLLWHHLDAAAGWIRLDASRTKSRRADDLPMHATISKAIEDYRKALGTIPGAQDRVFRHGLNRYTWLRDLARAGLIRFVNGTGPQSKGVRLVGYRDDRGRVLGIQCLRKTFGTHLAMVEPNVANVAKLMRHSDPRLTLKLYTDARLLDLTGSLGKLVDPAPVARKTTKHA